MQFLDPKASNKQKLLKESVLIKRNCVKISDFMVHHQHAPHTLAAHVAQRLEQTFTFAHGRYFRAHDIAHLECFGFTPAATPSTRMSRFVTMPPEKALFL